jgi:hypothetical protein
MSMSAHEQEAMNRVPALEPTEPTEAASASRRTRRFVKRRFRVVPRMPLPVKALWDQASAEEKAQAHKTCAVILQMWLGKISRAKAAELLQLTPLRVWQLSQQALAGMVAGNLKQPRWQRRKGGALMALSPEEDPKRLRKRIFELERQLKIAEDVIQLLREFPVHREQEKAAASATERSTESTREEAGGVPGRKKKRPGTRRSPPKSSSGTSPELADGAGANPAA